MTAIAQLRRHILSRQANQNPDSNVNVIAPLEIARAVLNAGGLAA